MDCSGIGLITTELNYNRKYLKHKIHENTKNLPDTNKLVSWWRKRCEEHKNKP